MKIAITGGAGFIGGVLAKRLKQSGHDILILDLKKSDAYPADSRIVDVQDRAALTEALKGIDAVYHLAAEHRDDVRPVQKYYDVNVGGAENLALAATANHIRTIVFSSSVAVYGLGQGVSNEEDVPCPFNDYGSSKLEAEAVLNAWAVDNDDNRLVTIRLVATFGPGNRGNIHTLMNQIAQNKFVMIGAGRNRKSIAYVENVAAFFEWALHLGKGSHLFNYADKPDLTTAELVSIVQNAFGKTQKTPSIPYAVGLAGGYMFDAAAKITGKRFPISAIRIQKFCADTLVDAQAARQAGFAPSIPLAEGLQRMIEADFKPQDVKAA